MATWTWPEPLTTLPFLPPITRNVKSRKPANRLECRIREEDTLDTWPKSGKNGNVHHPSQLCHAACSSPLAIHPMPNVTPLCLPRAPHATLAPSPGHLPAPAGNPQEAENHDRDLHREQ